jgi:cytochrome c553
MKPRSEYLSDFIVLSERKKMYRFWLILAITYTPLALASGLTPDSKLVQECGTCHGLDGNSALPNVPNLAGQLRGYLLWQLRNEREFKVHSRESKKMGELVDQLSDGDINKLAEYFSVQKPKPSAPDNSVAPDLIAKGKHIYERRISERVRITCGNCHGNNAEGTANRKGKGLEDFPRLAGQKRDYLVSRLRKYASGEVGYGLLGMNMVASSLNDDEINALAAYLSSLQ